MQNLLDNNYLKYRQNLENIRENQYEKNVDNENIPTYNEIYEDDYQSDEYWDYLFSIAKDNHK